MLVRHLHSGLKIYVFEMRILLFCLYCVNNLSLISTPNFIFNSFKADKKLKNKIDYFFFCLTINLSKPPKQFSVTLRLKLDKKHIIESLSYGKNKNKTVLCKYLVSIHSSNLN